MRPIQQNGVAVHNHVRMSSDIRSQIRAHDVAPVGSCYRVLLASRDDVSADQGLAGARRYTDDDAKSALAHEVVANQDITQVRPPARGDAGARDGFDDVTGDDRVGLGGYAEGDRVGVGAGSGRQIVAEQRTWWGLQVRYSSVDPSARPTIRRIASGRPGTSACSRRQSSSRAIISAGKRTCTGAVLATGRPLLGLLLSSIDMLVLRY